MDLPNEERLTRMKKFKFTIAGNRYDVSIDRMEGSDADVTVNGVTYTVEVERAKAPTVHIERPKAVTGAGPQPARMKPQGSLGSVRSPLPGVIKSVAVREGDEVKDGQIVLILEAMKMENEVYASRSGKVAKLHVAAEQSVLEGDALLDIE